ncbi:OmpA family protein [Dyadobacter psychrotolerans]|uniref:Flagellar motor protein MotB n=1 Tax=Dyadobacter psychrotolerans TaxID=2541721 RepID=A0A4R5DXY4_9BACT|nr:OmpA family protein [Dyadobacter psychrotolerans]TDE16205.1 flagellar motor protein MotB [Dyadobacter psychrotolerans]
MSLYKITLSFLFLVSTGNYVVGQQILWANKVLGYSSESRPDQYGNANRSKQILGEPNKLPAFGKSPCAWSPADPDGRSEEWIKVGFEKSVALKQVAIGENFNPGSIARVYAYDEDGKEYLIWKNNPAPVNVAGRMLNIFPEQKDIKANAVKIVLQPDKVPGFNQVDAIAISDQTKPVEAVINLATGASASKLVKENLGSAVNTAGLELNPVISPDGKTLYFTREGHPENIGGDLKTQDIWYSTLGNKNQWGKAVNMGPPLNNKENNAVISISSDGKTLYLVNQYRVNTPMAYGLSESLFSTNTWTFPKDINVANPYNLQEGMEVSVSPKSNVMILATERRDTEGDKDLYVSFLQKDNNWSEPLNMGNVLNSADYDGSPFISHDNQTLYFSSSGHSGYGQSDFFMSKRLDDTWTKWSKPVNLGPIINSPKWDLYISIPTSGETAYFSSIDKSLGSYDIFKLALPKELKPDPMVVVTGNVTIAGTNSPVHSDLVADIKKNNTVFTTATFDPETGDYRILLPAKEVYRLTASEKGYFPATEEIDLLTDSVFTTIKKNLVLQPMKAGQQIRLTNTIFQQSSAEVNATSYPELDRIVAAMNEYPAMEILLEGHTDNQGDVQKNVKLSEDRVQQVKKYLLSKGIAARRIQTKAWGPAKPIASNQTEQTRQKNRRVEFTILKI